MMNGCETVIMQFVYLLCNIASKREVSRRATRSESASASREHAQVGPMTDVKGQSTRLAS